jgi:hypothetical protein
MHEQCSQFMPIKFETGKIPNPSAINISENDPLLPWYVSQCLDTNEKFLHDRLTTVYDYFQKELSPDLLQHISILVVGSDGRLENAPDSITLSPVEFCILSKTEEHAIPVLDAIQKGIQTQKLKSIEASVECKLLNSTQKDYVLSGYCGDKNKAWPDRILDAVYLMGSEEYVKEAYFKIFDEWNTNKSVRNSIKAHLKKSRRTTLTGLSRDDKHFDRDTGELFFDKNLYIRGLKYGPIRLVQHILTIRQLVRQGADGVLPTSTHGKLAVLYPHEQHVIDTYCESLVIYHQQQSKRANGETGYIQVNPVVLNNICDVIYSFSEREYNNLMHTYNAL